MLTILSRETSSRCRSIVYESLGRIDVFSFPLGESMERGEERLRALHDRAQNTTTEKTTEKTTSDKPKRRKTGTEDKGVS